MEAGVNEKLASDESVVLLLQECLYRHSQVYWSTMHNLKHPSITEEGKKSLTESMAFHEERLAATCELYLRTMFPMRWRDVMRLPEDLRAKVRQRGLTSADDASHSVEG